MKASFFLHFSKYPRLTGIGKCQCDRIFNLEHPSDASLIKECVRLCVCECRTCVANFSTTDDNSMYMSFCTHIAAQGNEVAINHSWMWGVVSLCLLRWFHARPFLHTLRPNLIHLSLLFLRAFFLPLPCYPIELSMGILFIWLMMNIVRGATHSGRDARVHGMAWLERAVQAMGDFGCPHTHTHTQTISTDIMSWDLTCD